MNKQNAFMYNTSSHSDTALLTLSPSLSHSVYSNIERGYTQNGWGFTRGALPLSLLSEFSTGADGIGEVRARQQQQQQQQAYREPAVGSRADKLHGDILVFVIVPRPQRTLMLQLLLGLIFSQAPIGLLTVQQLKNAPNAQYSKL